MKAMREYAKKRKWKIVQEVKEVGSGANNKRPERDKLIKLAKQRKIDAVVVWKFDRPCGQGKKIRGSAVRFCPSGRHNLLIVWGILSGCPFSFWGELFEFCL